ncbi:MAG TPA: hypothetical protein VN887_04570 [Candidatus Angelobacter sp.]|nr:hypothetical protein [Candidatus Angelobacter sp.]
MPIEGLKVGRWPSIRIRVHLCSSGLDQAPVVNVAHHELRSFNYRVAQVFAEAGLRGLNKKETLDAPGASPSL